MNNDVTWVAVAGFLLSLVSLGTQIVQGVRNRARIAVSLRGNGYAFADPAGDFIEQVEYTVVVQNLGKSPETVWDVGLEDKRKGAENDVAIREVRFLKEKTDVYQASFGVDPSSATVDGPALPHQLPVGAVAEWKVLDEATRLHDPTAQWRAFAVRLRRRGREKVSRGSEPKPRIAFFPDEPAA
ncbi:hypothetical protein [Curtobacterium sp. MCPF17_021]|uniref:hypothetical protein n=1 Tax=Curtobacterium sp. MCPF17_021 TaxID=2175639 RepID=UPI000DA73D41|nr:hypothetical protein [Curtobacterium sp. MCPF17_021]WIE81735.1 hypothetical protein DEJ29_009910 [Curtobacterium sp. MCPF17_021]